jgi:hypothetical protein
VEYAARGILFTYSEDNDDFDGQPYVLKQFANDTPININALVRFIKSNNLQPLQIRQTVDPEMSWNTQMAKVVDQLQ